MKTFVVYESMFGNTARLADAVGRGLGDATVIEVNNAVTDDLADADLIVFGGPTHAFSMSRPATREEAKNQGAASGKTERGLREFIATLPNRIRIPVATFDSRVSKACRLPGSAAKASARDLRRHHGARVVRQASFFVEDTAGPLLNGEVERAEAWGRELAERVPAS